MTTATALRFAALVLFIVSAVLAFLTTTPLDTDLGLIATGLAAWVGSTFNL